MEGRDCLSAKGVSNLGISLAGQGWTFPGPSLWLIVIVIVTVVILIVVVVVLCAVYSR